MKRTEFPICPHCGREDLDVWMQFTEATSDGDKLKYLCGQCGGEIAVVVHIDLEDDDIGFSHQDKMKEQLVTENLRLVPATVHKFFYRLMCGPDRDDALSAGYMGLVRAAKHFDESLGYQFSTMAVVCIRREVYRQLIHPTKTIKRQADNGVAYLDAPVADEDCCLIDMVSGGSFEEDKIIDRVLLFQALNELRERDRDIIHKYYIEGWPQLEIAKEYGISRGAVKMVIKRGLKRLRNILDPSREEVAG